jgi:hypothetical protein
MKTFVLTSLALLVLTAGLYAESEEGGYAGSFLQLGLSARATAMGQAYYAVSDDASSIFYNPGGAPHILRREAGLSYRVMDLDRKLGYATVIFPVRNEATIGIGWIFAGVSDVVERDRLGGKGDVLDASENAISLSFARKFSHYVSIGATGKLYIAKLANVTTNTVGFDLGTYLKFDREHGLPAGSPIDLLRFGFVAGNLGAKYIWTTGEYWAQYGESGDSRSDDFPLLIAGGASVLFLKERLLFALDARKYRWHDARLYFGAEYVVAAAFVVRAGLDDMNPTLGGGIRHKLESFDLTFDYGYSSSRAEENADHIISIGLVF